MSHIRYHGVLLWNDVAIDGLIVGTKFGTFSAPDARIRTLALLYPPLVAQTMQFWYASRL